MIDSSVDFCAEHESFKVDGLCNKIGRAGKIVRAEVVEASVLQNLDSNA